MHPERIAAELDARTPGWAIFFGRYSMQLVALHLNGPGVVAASSVAELERRMALVEAALLSRRNTAQGRPGTSRPAGPGRYGTQAPPPPNAPGRGTPPRDGAQRPGSGRR